MGETWFTRKWDDDGWFISKLGPDVLRPNTNPNTLQAWKKQRITKACFDPGSQKLVANLRWSGQSQIVFGMGLSFQDQTPAIA